MTRLRESTIKYIVPDLRARWKDELSAFTDNQIAGLYEDFSLSDEKGDNDAKFPLWFPMLPDYPKES